MEGVSLPCNGFQQCLQTKIVFQDPHWLVLGCIKAEQYFTEGIVHLQERDSANDMGLLLPAAYAWSGPGCVHTWICLDHRDFCLHVIRKLAN